MEEIKSSVRPSTPEEVAQEQNDQKVCGSSVVATALESSATAAIAPKPKELTRTEIGKLRRQYITKVYGTVTACGHKFHPTDDPRTNCPDCWEAYFRVHDGIVAGVQSILAAFSEKQLIMARGAKFVKRYKQYAAMVEAEQAPTTIGGENLPA